HGLGRLRETVAVCGRQLAIVDDGQARSRHLVLRQQVADRFCAQRPDIGRFRYDGGGHTVRPHYRSGSGPKPRQYFAAVHMLHFSNLQDANFEITYERKALPERVALPATPNRMLMLSL